MAASAVCGSPWVVRAIVACGILGTLITVSSAPAEASSALYGFYNITGNDPASAAVGEAQLFVELIDSGTTVTFNFMNVGPLDSTISEVYFDDGTLLGISSILDAPPLVDFRPDANPSNLPGGNLISPVFEVTQGFLAEAVPPPAKTGVDPFESVAIEFSLQAGGTFQDVCDELADGTLRIGIHVISFPNGESESFVNYPLFIPEPASVTLLALGGLPLLRRRR